MEVGQFLPDSDSSRSDAMNRFKVLAALNPGSVRELESLCPESARTRQPVHAAGLQGRAGTGMVGVDQRRQPDEFRAIGQRRPGLSRSLEPLAGETLPGSGCSGGSVGIGTESRGRCCPRNRDAGRIDPQSGFARSRLGALPGTSRARFSGPCHGFSTRGTRSAGSRDEHERLDESRDQPADSQRNGLRGRPFLRRSPPVL